MPVADAKPHCTSAASSSATVGTTLALDFSIISRLHFVLCAFERYACMHVAHLSEMHHYSHTPVHRPQPVRKYQGWVLSVNQANIVPLFRPPGILNNAVFSLRCAVND